jgi:hypothetical protein
MFKACAHDYRFKLLSQAFFLVAQGNKPSFLYVAEEEEESAMCK